MFLKKEVADIFENEPYHQFATASNDGKPNICNIGAKFIRDDGKIVIVDNFMKKTIANLQKNSEIAILIRKEKESYQIKGTALYLTSGEEYDQAYKWMKAKGDKYPVKGAIIIAIHSVYNSMTGKNAGEKLQ